jgi:hypothetical protein
MRKIRIVPTLVAIFLPVCLIGQGAIDGSNNTYLSNYVQPAPDVASLGKYADYPVSYFTGVPEISIPIYQLRDGAVKLPISISYHASGLKVAEIASWVGLGWSLNAGGMIMRTVRGAPDEGTRKAYTSFAQGPRGYYENYGLSTLPLLPYPGASNNLTDNPAKLVMQMYTLPALSHGALDCEPDLFTFNFNGHAGKFIFDENRTPRLLTDDNIQILPNYSNYLFNSWVITTADGTKYFFGENNVQEVTNPNSILSGNDIDAELPSAWYLTRIVYPNTLDTVYLSYTAESYQYNDLGPESKLYDFVSGTPVPGGVPGVCGNNPQQNMIKTNINGYRLTTIRSRNYSISFIADTARQDLPRLYTSMRLDSIKVFNSSSQCIEQFALHYSYTQSGYATQCLMCNTQNPAWPVDSSDAKRLRLLSLKQVSGDGTMSKPPYIFAYQDSFQLPRRMSYDQDHWGYSNYAQGNINPFFTPPVSLPTCTYSGGANRNSNWPQMEAGVLNSIRDPLGVLTQFVYQANNVGGTIGGLRIQSITATDSVTGLQQVKSYTYQGGVLFKIPNYLVNIQNEYFILPSALTETPGYEGYNFQLLNNIVALLKLGQSFVPLQDAQGNQVGYTSVTETYGNRGQGGSKVYTYQMNLGPHGDSRLSIYNYASYQDVNTTFNGAALVLIGDSNFNNILPQNLLYAGSESSIYYPLAPDQVDVMRGQLSNEFTYDSLGNLLKNVYYTYNPNYHESYWTRGLKSYSFPEFNGNNEGGLGYVPAYMNALTFYKLHTGISHLVSSTETDYKDGKILVTIHNLGYEDTLHTLQTSDTTLTSQGDSIIKKTYYSFDYANTATSDGVFAKMKARNQLQPVSTRVWKNNQLISGTVTQYQDFASSGVDSFINPAKIYAFQTSVPMTPSQAGESIAFSSPWPSLLPNTSFIEKADFLVNGTTGKIIQQKLVNDKDQALIWDNVQALPLAQADNAYFTDIAYNSFESTETGNLTFNAGSVVSDATAPTGSHAYALSSSYPISDANLNSAQTYVVSYWLKSGASASVSGGTQSGAVTGRTVNGYTYHEIKVTGITSLSITGSGNVDEVKIYPSTAQMTTYTYDALMRLIAECSANSTISYYDYDSLNRVIDIRDQYGNVIKAFQYNYGRQSRASQ